MAAGAEVGVLLPLHSLLAATAATMMLLLHE